MLLGNENLLSKKEEIIKTVYISEIVSLMSVPIKETKTITSVMPVKIKLFKWWLYSGFFFTVMLWAASIELLLGLVVYFFSCFKFFACLDIQYKHGSFLVAIIMICDRAIFV